MLGWLAWLRVATDLAGTLVLVASLLAALIGLARSRDLRRTQRLVADGVLFALNIKVAATLLRTTELISWSQLGLFAALFVLRTLLSRFLSWERRQLD